MSEKLQETVLTNLTDDLATSFFEGGASSNNVILPETPSTEEPEKKEKQVNQPLRNLINEFDTTELIQGLLDEDDDEPAPAERNEEDKKGPGRPKKQEGLNFDVANLFDDETLLPFADDKPVNSLEDFKELIKANKIEERNAGKEEALKEYKESLPDSLRLILDYTENGGTDLDGFLKAVGQSKQITDLNVDKEFDQKEIIRQYYSIQEWSQDEIEDEIETLLDAGEDKLKNLATKLKPKLDRMQEQQVQYQIQKTKEIQDKQEKAQAFYVKNVVDSLKKGALNDIKISKEEQRDLYSALIEERYQTVNGGQTNRLGALLDKIQFVEPNYELLAEVTLLLSDPKAYKTKIREQVKKEVTADTIKTVKTEQGLRKAGSGIEQPENARVPRKLNSGFRNPF